MRPALDAPHMSLTILITSNSANNRPIRHDTHTTAARNAVIQLAAPNTPNKTVFRFPHHAARIHALKPAPARLAHQSTTSHVSERHITRGLHHSHATHIHIIAERTPMHGHKPQVTQRLRTHKTAHQTRTHARLGGRPNNIDIVRRAHRPHSHAHIIPRDTTTITNRSRRTSEPATRRSITLSEESLALRHRREMRDRSTIGTHQPAPARLRTTPNHAARSIAPHANMKTSHNQPHPTDKKTHQQETKMRQKEQHPYQPHTRK